MDDTDLLAVREVIRLLPLYSRELDFDIVRVAYQNVKNRLEQEVPEELCKHLN